MTKAIRHRLVNDPSVSAIIGDRCFDLVVPQGQALPAIIYQVVASTDDLTQSGPTNLYISTLRLTCLANGREAVEQLAAAATAAINGQRWTAEGESILGVHVQNFADLPHQAQQGRNHNVRGKLLTVWVTSKTAEWYPQELSTMPSDATPGYGASIGYTDLVVGGDYSGSSYTALAQVGDVPMPESDVEEVEISNQDSPTGASGLPVAEFLPTWITPGEIELELVYTKAQFATLNGLNGVSKHWKVTLSDGSSGEFNGWVKKPQVTSELKGKVIAKTSIRATGEVGFAPAA
jgi:hypothetical protein